MVSTLAHYSNSMATTDYTFISNCHSKSSNGYYPFVVVGEDDKGTFASFQVNGDYNFSLREDGVLTIPKPYKHYCAGMDGNNEYTSYYMDYDNGMRHAWGSYQRHTVNINSAYYGMFQGTEFFYMHNAPFSKITTIQVTPNSSGDTPVVNATTYLSNSTGLSIRFLSSVSLSNFTIKIYYDVWGYY